MKLAVMAAILAVVACDKGEPAGTAQEITLRQTPSEVGDVVTTTEELGMEMTFRGGKDATVSWEKRGKSRREVMAVDGEGTITRARFAYEELREIEVMAAEKEVKALPLEGRTYVVARQGDRLEVTRDDGSAPSAEEMAVLYEEHGDFGEAHPLSRVINGKTWRTGIRVVLDADEVARANVSRRATNIPPDDAEHELTALALTLRNVAGTRAHFDLEMGFTVTDARGEMRIRLAGPFEIDTVDDELGRFDAKGTLEGTNSGVPFTGAVRQRMAAR